MKRRRALLTLLLFLSAATHAQKAALATSASKPRATDPKLARKIQALLADPAAARSHWGIAVTTLDGEPIFGLDEAKLFRPASTAKLFTTAAAMHVIGPDSTVKTSVYGDLDRATGVVHGDLELKGDGDANFGRNDKPSSLVFHPGDKQAQSQPPFHDLEVLADQLVANGVKQIAGKVVGWDIQFSGPPYPEGWNQDDLIWGYGAPTNDLTIDDNQLRLTITPQKGLPATVVLDQGGIHYYMVRSDVQTGAAGSGTVVKVRREGTQTLHVLGSIPPGPPHVERIAIDDPALFAATALRDVLIRHGIQVDGGADTLHSPYAGEGDFLAQLDAPLKEQMDLVSHDELVIPLCPFWPDVGPELASVQSVSLADDMYLTNKTSQNLHAEIMLRQLGRVPKHCGRGSIVEGARMVRAFLQYAGIDTNDFLFFDGSGLSTKDLVTPRAEAQLLAFAAKQPWFAQWKAGLPVGGVDGTLAERFKEPPLKGHVFAKTGTLGESRALAGYLDCASGRQVIFSILEDDHLPGTSADKDVMDRIVAAIAAAE